MASTFIAMSSVGSIAAPSNKLASSNKLSFGRRQNVALRKTRVPKIYAAKELHFNKDGDAVKKLQVSICPQTLSCRL